MKEGTPMASVPIYPARTPILWRWLAPLASRWTYTRLLYLALTFPLGLVYFVALVVGLAVGGSLVWTIPGLALLLAVVATSRWGGDLEAMLARHLVGIEIRRPPTWYERDVPLREQARQVLTDPSTWTGLIYLLTHLVTGIVAFVLLVLAGAFAFVFTAAPAFQAGWFNLEIDGSTDYNLGAWAIDTTGEAWALVPLGLLLVLVSLHLANGLAVLHARWARLMLGSRARDIPAPPATLQDGPPVVAMPAQGLIVGLTPREREVLLLIARGYSNAEIAEAFVVSEGTVKTHVKRILAKLNVRDRTQAAILAFDSGFVTPEMASEPEPR
jgi:DNA-binding CsgD family transcriptional regulator